MTPDMSKQQIRTLLRQQRHKLTRQQQRRAGEALARHLSRQLFFLRARHVAFYLPNDGEIDPTFLLRLAASSGKKAALPVLDPSRPGHLCFLPWKPGEPLKANKYGIPEPVFKPQNKLPLWKLDIVCLPLVAFDRDGNRLGMGGGFYDRTFASAAKRLGSRPLLVGMAHHFQQVDAIAADPWDVPLHAIATDQRLLFNHRTTESKPST